MARASSSSTTSAPASSVNSNNSATKAIADKAPRYQVPALEKGLDILEHLATEGIPLTQAELARALGRSPNELFRMLVSLERRGYIQRDPGSGAYSLTLRLFEMSHTHSPLSDLVACGNAPDAGIDRDRA